jgi:hypothetical protein
MTPFKSIIVVKHRPERLWVTIRDRMSDLAAMLDDVERVTVLERQVTDNGDVRLLNEWRAKPLLPAAMSSLVDPALLGWHDRAEWHEAERRCTWSIEPFFLPGRIQCTGVTSYEEAMGGRGARVTFEGTLALDLSTLMGPSVFDRGLNALAENIVTTLIPKNFRKTVEAAARVLEREA